MRWRQRLRPVIASVIILSWLGVELAYGSTALDRPTLELRLMLVAALIWMFGESVSEAVEIVRGGSEPSADE